MSPKKMFPKQPGVPEPLLHVFPKLDHFIMRYLPRDDLYELKGFVGSNILLILYVFAWLFIPIGIILLIGNGFTIGFGAIFGLVGLCCGIWAYKIKKNKSHSLFIDLSSEVLLIEEEKIPIDSVIGVEIIKDKKKQGDFYGLLLLNEDLDLNMIVGNVFISDKQEVIEVGIFLKAFFDTLLDYEIVFSSHSKRKKDTGKRCMYINKQICGTNIFWG